MELWEPIKGMEGHYEVAKWGRIKSLKRIKKQWNGYKYIEYEIPEKIRKPRYFNGYYIVNLTIKGIRQQEWVHLETGKLYNSSRQAGKDLNLSDANIRRSCKTNGRSAVKGNHFRYII